MSVMKIVVTPSGPRWARKSGLFGNDKHLCKHPWPPECFCQCGENGLVLGNRGSSAEEAFGHMVTGTSPAGYRTAFFEAFPPIGPFRHKDPEFQTDGLFIRGEGKTLLEAEDDCWRKFRLYYDCLHHEIVRHPKRTDGWARCKKCGMTGSLLPPSTRCCKCDAPTYHYRDDDKGEWYCEDCMELAEGQPCHICGKSNPPTTLMEPAWSKNLPRPSEEKRPYREFLHPECEASDEDGRLRTRRAFDELFSGRK